MGFERACSDCLSARGSVLEFQCGLSPYVPFLVPHILLVLSLPEMEVWHMWLEIPAMLSLLLRALLGEGSQSALCGPSLSEQGSD